MIWSASSQALNRKSAVKASIGLRIVLAFGVPFCYLYGEDLRIHTHQTRVLASVQVVHASISVLWIPQRDFGFRNK